MTEGGRFHISMVPNPPKPLAMDRNVKAEKAAQCPTCRFFVYQRVIIAGKPSESPACERRIVAFPEATNCRDYEREPGAD
jgi:hypothetical protein